MTENKRYSEQNLENHLNRIYDNQECKVIFDEDIVDLLNKKEDEIQRLKRTMKGVAELLSIEADLFSDKATEHDINAYRELQKFDNKDAYYMAISIKKAIKIINGDVE